MAGYDLPTSLEVGGVEREIRSDYRAILDVVQVMADPEITDGERVAVALAIFYLDDDKIEAADLQEAVERMYWFVGGGESRSTNRPRPRLMDWEQDFALIAAPVNHVLGYEVRAVPYDFATNEGGLHWWTFLAAYGEIGDCTFAQVVNIRKKRLEGKKLDEQERRFYRDNRDLVELRRQETQAESELFDQWT